MVLMEILGIIALIIAVLTIVDIYSKNRKLNSTEKLVWTVFAIIFSIITGVVYYFIFKYKRKRR